MKQERFNLYAGITHMLIVRMVGNFLVFKNRVYREGFAEWVSYKVLEELGYRSQIAGMKSRKDIYGEGLRIMLKAEKRGGVEEVLRTAMY